MGDYYSERAEKVLANLKSSIRGLSEKEVLERRKKYGYNEVEVKEKISAFTILVRQLKNMMVIVLLVSAFISIFFGSAQETIVIFAIILFVIVLSFFEEYKASKDMEALEQLHPKKARIIRAGKRIEVGSRELVPGDIIILERGDLVPADARLIELSDLRVDESLLTGESTTVTKILEVVEGKVPLGDQLNMVFGGTSIVNGSAKAVVIATGLQTEIGKISHLLASVKQEQTPLQKRLDRMTKQITFGTFVVCLILFVIGVLRGYDVPALVIIALGVLIAGMPESLPAVVTVALSIGIKRMAQQNAIVKSLPAVETLGATTVICTDKTGTLTQNKMVIENIFTLDDEISVTGAGYRPEGMFLREDKEIDPTKHHTISKLIEIGVLCNNAILHKEDDWKIKGEATEGALIVLAKKAGVHKEIVDKQFKRIKEHPFDPIRKIMSTVHVVKKQPIVYTKGAPERVLKKCTRYLQNGKISELSKKIEKDILQKNEAYGKKGLRVLALAYKEHKATSLDLQSVETGLIFVGLVSIRDPPEPSAKGSIKMCQEAGIRVVMITGDNEHTARAIAVELGIFTPNSSVVTGEELDTSPREKLEAKIETVSVFARVTPEHKLKIVTMLQEKGHIVAMTGDGVNDGPALKKANIGVAMGLSGTEVAKESAEMVILDDNFTTIANAVREGRTIYENIRKFVYFALVGGFSTVILMLVSGLMGTDPVLTGLMILFVNLVTGDLPSFGLCLERPHAGIMKQRPRDVKEGILSEFLLLKTAEMLPLIVFGTLFLFVFVDGAKNLPKAQTVVFATIIFYQLFNVFNAKSWDESIISKSFYNNKILIFGVIASVILTVLVIHLPAAQAIFGTVSLSAKEWLMVIGMSSTVIFFREIEKTIVDTEIAERQRTSVR